MTIRKLTAADMEQFRKIRIDQVTDTPRAFAFTAEELRAMPAAEVAGLIGPTDATMVLGYFDGPALAAVIGLRRENREKTRHKVNIWAVYTASSHRRQGIARQLLKGALDAARTEFRASVATLAVDATNDLAIHFYQSLGFVRYGQIAKSLKVANQYVAEDLMFLDLEA